MANKQKKAIRICIFVVFLTLLVVGGVLGATISSINTEPHFIVQIKESKIEENPDVWFEVTSDFSWLYDGRIGAQFDCILHNSSGRKICDWNLTIDVPESATLDSYWNGFFELEDGKLHVEPVLYNEVVAKDGEIPFGFILYLPISYADIDKFLNDDIISVKWLPSTFAFSYKNQVTITEMRLFWVIVIGAAILFSYVLIVSLFAIRLKKIKQREKSYRAILNETLETFVNIIDAKDSYTEGHSRRVAIYSKEIARRMGLEKEMQEKVYYIAMLHDIGKVAIPDSILKKPENLSEEEMKLMQTHPVQSGKILSDFSSIEGIGQGVLHHHERFDGNGYPDGLKAHEIPLVSRIICIADSYDAMALRRCYREEMTKEEIIEELSENSGLQFDPFILPFMIDMINDGFVFSFDLAKNANVQ